MALWWWLVAAGAWAGWAAIAPALMSGPRRDIVTGTFWWLSKAYALVFHRLRVVGRQNLADAEHVRPLILVANHTAGVDPVLIQTAAPFLIRWMMAEDMRHPAGEFFWRWAEVIFVNRQTGDATGAREAIRYVKSGGVLGIFPEGGIARPAGRVQPFMPGVGLIVARTGARVLPVIVRGTPDVTPAWASLWRTSRATLEFKPLIEYSGRRWHAGEIAEDLRRRYVEWTGWPATDETPIWRVAPQPGARRAESAAG